MKYIIKALYIFSLSLAFTVVHAQELVYDVVKGNKIVGKLVVKKHQTAEKTTYTIDSKVALKILFTFNVDFQAKEDFHNGELVDGEAISKLNGRTQKDSYITQSGKGISVKLNGSDYDYSDAPITYSVPMLYFEAPGSKKKIFSQQFAKYIPIDFKDGRYVMDSPDGYNYYTYENGYCKEVEVNRDFANFYFKLKEVK